MERGDAQYGDLDRSLDSVSSELDELKFDSREATPADQGFARSKKIEDDILSQIKKTIALGSNTLDLSNKGLLQIPEEVLNIPVLEYLYLEGNDLAYLPDEFFDCLPNLKWLDLRRNRLSRLPSVYLGRHKNLRNLLLESNNLKSLPLELGLVKTISGLNISKNPLEFPPLEIIEKGSQEILKFLYEMLQAKASAKSNFDEDGIANYDDGGSDHSDDDWNNENYTQERSPYQEFNQSGHNRKTLVGPVPLSAELHRPVSYSDRKQIHTEKLRKAGAMGTLDSPLYRRNLINQHRRKVTLAKHQKPSNSKNHSAKDSIKSWRVNQYPEPPPHEFVDIKMAEERKTAKVKELKERQDAILQRRRDEQSLKDWRDDSKKLQQRKYFQALQNGKTDYEEPVSKAPFAIEKDHIKVMSNEERIKTDVKAAHEKLRRPMSPGTKQRIEAEKSARIRELEKRIKEHSTGMLDRRKQPKGTPQHEMAAAQKELAIVFIDLDKETIYIIKTAEELQRELQVRRTELEYRFKAFTADISSGYTKTTRLKP